MTIILIDPAHSLDGRAGKEGKQNSAYGPLRGSLFFPPMRMAMDMKHRIQNRWVVGGFAFLFIWLFPLTAYCQKAFIKEIAVKGKNGAWKISFYVENCFTPKMEEAIQTGIRTIFTFYLHLYQKRNWWKDRKVAALQFHHTIQYDPIRGEYHVTLEENHSSFVTSSIEEAKRLMAKVEEVEIRPSSQLKPGVPAQLRIKAKLDPVRLPLHLEYLFFFVSLWDFETDWHIQALRP